MVKKTTFKELENELLQGKPSKAIKIGMFLGIIVGLVKVLAILLIWLALILGSLALSVMAYRYLFGV